MVIFSIMKSVLFILIFSFIHHSSFSQDSAWIKVHFLYGSKPIKLFKDTEKKCVGGVMGGHVGIESDRVRVINFSHQGSFHVFANDGKRHSKFSEHTCSKFYGIFGSHHDSVKKAIVFIPVSRQQKHQFDSISAAYLKQSPYDYALFGMRCGAASYEILAQLGILPDYSNSKTAMKIFYPKKLRTRLLQKAKENGWLVLQQQGSYKRIWEKG